LDKDKSLTKSKIANQKSEIPLSLPLFMLRVGADHTHHAFAVDDLAVIAHFFN
jgi:hypothetical protein